MSWKEIIKQPRRPGPRPPQRPGSGGGTRDREEPLKLIHKPVIRGRGPKTRTTARDITVVAPTTETETETDTEYEDECQCQQAMCKRKAEYKCRKCGKSFCVAHTRRAEAKDRGRAKRIHGFEPWDCENDKYYSSVDDLRDEVGEP